MTTTSTRPTHSVFAPAEPTLPLALALGRLGALTGRRTVRPVEEMITGDGPMIACEVAWLGLFCAGLAAAG